MASTPPRKKIRLSENEKDEAKFDDLSLSESDLDGLENALEESFELEENEIDDSLADLELDETDFTKSL